MNARIYDHITSVGILLAIASALLFERAPNLHLLAGAVGIFGGAITLFVYFYNRTRSGLNEHLSERPQAEAVGLMDTIVPSGKFNLSLGDLTAELETGGSELAWSDSFEPLTSQQHLELKRWPRSIVLSHYHASYQRRRTFADEIIEIVSSLCSEDDPSFEFVLTPDGNFTIRHFGPSKEHALQMEMPLRESDVPQSTGKLN
jgi:hypothetical protein